MVVRSQGESWAKMVGAQYVVKNNKHNHVVMTVYIILLDMFIVNKKIRI